MAQKILGIDITNRGVSALLLESGISGHQIRGFRHVSFSDLKPDDDAIAAAVKSAVHDASTASAPCAVSIPGRPVFFRNLRLPPFEAKKIRSILSFELEPLLPLPAEDLTTDFTLFKGPQEAEQTHVVTASIPKSELSRWLEISRAAGIEPETVTFKGCALACCLAEMTPVPSSWMLVDIDPPAATLFAFESGQLGFVRCASIPSDEALFKETLPAVIIQTIGAVEALYSFFYHPEVIKIDCNTGKRRGEQWARLEKELGIPVRPLNLAQELKPKSLSLPDSFSDSGPANGALSLALTKSRRIRQVQFLQESFSPKRQFVENKSQLITTGVLLMIALMLAGGYFFFDMRSMEKKVSRLDARMTQMFRTAFPEEKVIVDPVAQMKAKIHKLKKRSLLVENQGNWIKRIDLLKELSTHLSEQINVEISRLTAGDRDLVMTGNTDTFNSVNAMKRHLERSALFKEVSISSANLKGGGNRVDFVLTIRF